MGILGMHQQMAYIAQRTKGFFLVLFLMCLVASQAIAADKIGAIAAVIGTVSIERGGEIIEVKPGSAVYENDKILTGSSSRAQVLLMDQTAINIGQKAELVLDKFVFNGDDDEVALKVTKGTFRFISGKVATKAPEKVNVETPVATIGVRGTEFIGQIGATDTTVALLNGRIEVANDISTQFVTNPGFGVTIDPTSGVISTPVKIPQAELEAVLNSVSTDREALLEEEVEAGS
ncbi:FecR domain-containing protein, partial [Burkholderiales bacterium]|nr:FecR domain-containing protein [Burkholderiales bacterium]